MASTRVSVSNTSIPLGRFHGFGDRLRALIPDGCVNGRTAILSGVGVTRYVYRTWGRIVLARCQATNSALRLQAAEHRDAPAPLQPTVALS